MKAISIRQPWAHLIVHGGKNVENRNWQTKYRGPILIHAAQGMARWEYDQARDFVREKIGMEGPNILPAFADLQRGGYVGIANLVACDRMVLSPWFVGPYGFALADRRPIPFMKAVGSLGVFESAWPLAEVERWIASEGKPR